MKCGLTFEYIKLVIYFFVGGMGTCEGNYMEGQVEALLNALKLWRPIREFGCVFIQHCRSQRPRSLRRRSTAACLLRLWVGISRAAWMFVVSVVCCQVEVSATSWSLVQRSPTDCGASLCDIETLWMRRPWPTGNCRAKNKQKKIHSALQNRQFIAARMFSNDDVENNEKCKFVPYMSAVFEINMTQYVVTGKIW